MLVIDKKELTTDIGKDLDEFQMPYVSERSQTPKVTHSMTPFV